MTKVGFDADIIILGAGIVGASCALLLAQAGIQIILVDTAPKPKAKRGHNAPKMLAINLSSQQLLCRLNVWDQISQQQIGLFNGVKVWDDQSHGSVYFDCAGIGREALGHIVPYQFIHEALHTQLTQGEGIRCVDSAEIVAVEVDDKSVAVTLSDSCILRAGLVIGATSQHAVVRDFPGINWIRRDYQQDALVCVVETSESHDQTAKQKFSATGPLAFLPLAEPKSCAVIWSTSPGKVGHLLSLDDQDFNKTLASAFDNEAGIVEFCGVRNKFSLFRMHAENYCQSRWVLIGDSAHSVHPLAGQGGNLGLLDSATLAEVLTEAWRQDRDLGEKRVLRRYERWRRHENSLMIMALDALKHGFESQCGGLVWGRGIGMNTLDMLPPLKNLIMEKAAGIAGDLPESVRVS